MQMRLQQRAKQRQREERPCGPLLQSLRRGLRLSPRQFMCDDVLGYVDGRTGTIEQDNWAAGRVKITVRGGVFGDVGGRGQAAAQMH